MYFYYDYSATHTEARAQVLDLLPTIYNSKAEVFIKTIDDRAISWTIFLNPLSYDVWIALILVGTVIAFILTGIEKLFGLTNGNCYFIECLKNFWIAMKANAGGKPSSVPKNNAYQIVLFDCLLIGIIIWIIYRAELTSKLSVVKLKMPFNDLESLYKSNYK